MCYFINLYINDVCIFVVVFSAWYYLQLRQALIDYYTAGDYPELPLGYAVMLAG